MLTPRIYGDDGRCLACQAQPIHESLEIDERQVLAQIEHTASMHDGLCPPAHEIAAIMAWPLDRVETAIEALVRREILAPLPKGMIGDFKGQYRCGPLATTLRRNLAAAQLRAQVAEEQVQGHMEYVRDLQHQIVELKGLRGTAALSAAQKKTALAENAELKAQITALQRELEQTRQMVEQRG
jgi:hypothetical protein